MGTPTTRAAQPALPPAAELGQWLAQQQHQDLLRFITCGSVDDGKSTLIGRLLWESHQVPQDQLAALAADSRRHGTQGGQIDLALLVDGLAAEREQGITIDVAHRFFSTSRRKFIVLDTPGHEQYTRNMVTAASGADVALLLVDARHGLGTQTRRHARLAALMGIRHVALVVNKMDLVDWRHEAFQAIAEDFAPLAQSLGLHGSCALPVSALHGDNVTQASAHMPWHDGPSLMGYLQTVPAQPPRDARLVFPVQWVNRPDAQFRGYSGSVAGGRLEAGALLRVTASGETARVQRIVTFDGDLAHADAGAAVTVVLDREVDASRGDILSLADAPLETTDQFEATLIWMDAQPGLVGRSYELKLANQWAGATLTAIKHRLDVDSGAHMACRQLALNDIAQCNLALSRPLAADAYERSRTLGAFILVDRFSQATVAAGLISHSLRRAQNVHRQALSIARADRERLNGHAGRVVWLTGLSGSGKSTLANALEQALHARGRRTYVLDGDNVRQGLNRDLGFTDADRVENIRRVAEVARLMMDAGLIVITAFISPFRAEREMARQLVGEAHFLEVFVDTPLEVCERRDPKGLYRKARSGQLPNMTGIDSPYEAPLQAEVVVDGSADLEQALQALVERMG